MDENRHETTLFSFDINNKVFKLIIIKEAT